MARRVMRQVNNRYITGTLAYDYGRLEREERRRREREQREYAERRARERAPRRKVEATPRHRERIRVSPLVVLGFVAAAVMSVMLLMSYAQLTTISNQVVSQQKVLASLEEEHVKLVSKYERTFDLAAIKEAAESAGMAKPSASQIYYILNRVVTSVGRNVASIVEYFN